jgi:Recombinase zinc beta ribbon domain
VILQATSDEKIRGLDQVLLSIGIVCALVIGALTYAFKNAALWTPVNDSTYLTLSGAYRVVDFLHLQSASPVATSVLRRQPAFRSQRLGIEIPVLVTVLGVAPAVWLLLSLVSYARNLDVIVRRLTLAILLFAPPACYFAVSWLTWPWPQANLQPSTRGSFFRVSPEIFSRVREVLTGKARPRKQIHEFAFSGLLRCAYDNCAVTAEFKKQKYTYYRCTGYRGRCELPYFREEVMAERLGQVLQAIRVPDDILAQLEESLLSDKIHEETLRKRQAERIEQRLALLRRRLEQAYVDRLDGKITEEFWEAKSAEWQEEEHALLASLRELERAENPERALDRVLGRTRE